MELQQALEIIKANMESPEVKDFLQPVKDQHFSKSLETWKKNTLPDIIKESTAQAETPEQIELKKLQSDLENMKAAAAKKEFESQVLAYGMSMGLPEAVCKNLAIDNMETAKGLIDNLSGQIKSVIELQIIKNANGSIPVKGDSIKSTFNLETIGNMSANEIYSNLDNLTK